MNPNMTPKELIRDCSALKIDKLIIQEGVSDDLISAAGTTGVTILRLSEQNDESAGSFKLTGTPRRKSK